MREQRIGRPVLTANQVLVWKLLADAGVTLTRANYGEVRRVRPVNASG